MMPLATHHPPRRVGTAAAASLPLNTQLQFPMHSSTAAVFKEYGICIELLYTIYSIATLAGLFSRWKKWQLEAEVEGFFQPTD